MKSSRESGLDYITHGAEGQNATDTRRDEEEEDNDEEEGGGVGGDGHAEGAKGEAAGEKEQAEEGHYPESSAAKTSQRWRPKLSRMERVPSSSSAEDEESQQTDRWVLLRDIEVCRQTDKQTDRWVLQIDWQVDRKTGGWRNRRCIRSSDKLDGSLAESFSFY